MAKTVLKKVKHIMTIGGAKYSFKSADVYGTFGSTFGVSKAPTPDNTVYDGQLGKDSFSDGTAIKIKARGVISSNGVITEARDFTYIVPLEKAKTALATIDSKTISINSKTYDLNSARIPGRRRFS